jgi:hypothetical protein
MPRHRPDPDQGLLAFLWHSEEDDRPDEPADDLADDDDPADDQAAVRLASPPGPLASRVQARHAPVVSRTLWGQPVQCLNTRVGAYGPSRK